MVLRKIAKKLHKLLKNSDSDPRLIFLLEQNGLLHDRLDAQTRKLENCEAQLSNHQNELNIKLTAYENQLNSLIRRLESAVDRAATNFTPQVTRGEMFVRSPNHLRPGHLQ